MIGEEQFIITEFINRGSVISFLEKATKKDVTPLQITKMARDAASGMGYLHQQGIVHRDLAARNLLISEVRQNDFIVKITDFGLSRKVPQGKYYNKSGKTGDPIKWAAPETFKPRNAQDTVFKGRISERSDRWSFGIVLYELFIICKKQPYSELSGNAQVKGQLGDKEDMSKFLLLEDAPDGIFQLMRECLNYESEKRPAFPVIADRLGEIEHRLKTHPEQNVWKEQDPVEHTTQTAVKDNTYGDDDDYGVNESEEKDE